MITVEEALKGKGIAIGPRLKDSVREADYQVLLGEKVTAAWQASFSVDGAYHAGIVAVTTHRLLCCSCVANNLLVATLPYSECIGIGEESGRLQKLMPVHCDGVEVIVKAPGAHIVQIRSKLLSAIEAAPLQKSLDLSPSVFCQSSSERRRIQAIKSAGKK